jgi:AraC-like DNA-binding protein
MVMVLLGMQTDAAIARVEALVEQVGRDSGLGVVYHDLDTREKRLNGHVCSFCMASLDHPSVGRYCRFACCNAAMQSFSSGEPYYTQCWAGLLFVTVASAPRNRVCGGISAGGFLVADDVAEAGQAVAARLHALPKREVDAFLGKVGTLKRITPSALRGAGLYLMEAACSSGLSSAAFFARQNAKYRQQREIAEAAADLRRSDPPDVLADTHQLVEFLGRQDREMARQFVSRYLARLLTVSNWDQDKLKAHLRVLLAVVTSQSILRGESWSSATSRELRFMNRLERAGTTEESCYEAAVMLQSHFGGGEPDDAVGAAAAGLPERVVAWLQAHFHEKVSASEAARAVGASLSRLTHQLPKETGKSFRDLLMEVRIAEAKRLLATTGLEVRDIADRCGFFDQSHMTRALRRAINLTPGQFRRLLKPTAEEVTV